MGASCTKFGGFLQNALIRWNANRPRREESHQKSWTERLLHWTMQELSHFATDAERRDLVSIGASVGFAASFGSPIGGLLFILDDVSCYFERRLLLRMLIGNAVGTLCLAIKHRDFSNFGIINLGTFDPNEIFETRLLETPLYMLIGIGGGLIGGCFCGSYLWLQRNIAGRFPSAWERRAKYQLLAVAILNKRFFCPHGQENEMAKIMFVSRITAIKDILVDPASYQQRTLLVVGLTFYTLTLITFSSCTMPLGLFTPTILVGASLGGACGNLLKQTIDGSVFPSTFALLGVASMLAGIQHSTVSVAVILVEGTGHIKVLLPVIVVVATFRYISQHIQQFDVFEAGIVIKKLAYLEHEKIPRYYDAIRVKDILIESHVLCLKDHETVGKLVEVLGNSPHQSFPVIETESGRFIGLVKRTQIVALLECGIFSKNKEICGFRSDRNGDALSYWAFCINDDRYEYLLSLPDEMRASVNKLNDKDEGQERRTLVNKEQKTLPHQCDYH
ncbi:hypothetical protein ACHAWO_012378 [Cyclotella atomus]|uniref:Chloride channel protein n=1 Tax=Cyclotella atomus TaxID=382360 RepID=A0ABD3MWR6_9STRA